MFGSIIPEPLATQVMVASPTRNDSAFGCVSVVMIPSAPTSGSSPRSAAIPLHAALDDVDRQRHADHAGGADEHLVGRGADFGRRGGGHAPRVLEPLLARGDVADLAVDDDRAEPSAADGLAAEEHRRAGELIAREHRGRRGIDVAHEQREILRGGLEPAVAARAAEPAGKDRTVVKGHLAGRSERTGAREVIRADVPCATIGHSWRPNDGTRI